MSATRTEIKSARVNDAPLVIENLAEAISQGAISAPDKAKTGPKDKRATGAVVSVDPDLERRVEKLLGDKCDTDYIKNPRGLRYLPDGNSQDPVRLGIDDNHGFLSPIPYEGNDWEEDPSWRLPEHYKARYEGYSKAEMEKHRLFRRGFRQWRRREWQDRWGRYRAAEILDRELVFRDFEAYDAQTGRHVPWGTLTAAEQDAFSTTLAQAEWYEGSCCRVSLISDTTHGLEVGQIQI